MLYKSNLLNHFKAIQSVLPELGSGATLNAADLRLEVRFGMTPVLFHPQFIEYDNNIKSYTPRFGPNVTAFIGWLPYFNKRWPLSNRKLNFKEFAVRNGIRTPAYSVDQHADMGNVVVKADRSSFGADVRGPFRHSSEYAIDTERGDFYEAYVAGTITKVWFWDGKAVCLEFEEVPKLVGDGVRSIEELAQEKLERLTAKRAKKALAQCRAALAFQDRALDTVLAEGEEILIDIRYGSAFRDDRRVRNVDLTKGEEPELAQKLDELGELLWNTIPEDLRPSTIFTVDGILDAQGEFWALEMNSNPFIHPYVYPTMLRSVADTVKKRIESLPPVFPPHAPVPGPLAAAA